MTMTTRFITKMIEELRSFWKNYIFQSLLANLKIFIILLFFRHFLKNQ